jgi:hypothetical protein
MDLYELSDGGELLVGDIFAGRECRIVVRDGVITREDIPMSKARDALDLYGQKLADDNAKARQRRFEAKNAAKEPEPEILDESIINGVAA